MDARSLLDEIDEMIARIETLNDALLTRYGAAAPKPMSDTARRLLKARQSRLWWLHQVRKGMLTEKPKATYLH